jgi:hypothetical protein
MKCRLLMRVMDVSHWMLTQNGLRGWDDFWMWVYQKAGHKYWAECEPESSDD